MGFWTKAWNFIRGKGYQEDGIKEEKPDTIQKEKLLKTEDTEIRKEEEPKETEEKPQEEKVEGTVKTKVETTTPTKRGRELIEAEKRLSSKGTIKDLNLQTQTTESTTEEFTPTRDLGKIADVYGKMLAKNRTFRLEDGTVDENMIDLIYQRRMKIQYRFSGNIKISTDKGLMIMSIDAILAEHIADIYNFIETGRKYSSQELQTLLGEAMNHFEKQYGSIGGTLPKIPSGTVTITDIKTEVTFG